MILKKTLNTLAEPRHSAGRTRISVFAAALGLVSGVIFGPGAWANEPTAQLSALAKEELSVIEPAGTLPESVEPTADELAPEPLEAVPVIDLDYVQDLTYIIEEARKQAQVEYLAQKLRKPPHTLQEYVQLAWAEASRRGLRPELLIAIIHKESTFQPKVQSRYGAQGLMQVVRRWHGDKLQKNESLFDPVVNVRVGTDVLEEYLEWADGDLPKALAKYSGNARGYANTIIDESHKLAAVADSAAAEVAMAPELFEPTSPAGLETDMRASSERAG
ncbi:lytic transglycosylase domain-containing protein [Pusillimonas sp.]|uniref:lytic transglycosylase domain-containing protein n=1 Tax=Pusillimonas sp. TaxID=3040095 RepID=UPI0037C92468